MRCDIAIVGGGIIGLSLALELRSRGLDTTVVTRDVPGEAAQRAGVATCGAAGMLALRDPRHPAELLPLMELSRSLYPQFLRRVAELTGTTIGMETMDRLDLLPGGGFARSPEPSVEPRRLWQSLFAACEQAGVRVVHAEVDSMHEQHGGAELRFASGPVVASRWVNCAGAWAARLQGSGLRQNAVRPRKGQMVRLENTAAQPDVIYTPDFYVCPRRDGSMLVGATVEDVGFDTRVEAQVVERFRDAAIGLLPGLAGARVLESWAGLRPGTPDNLPLLGQVTDCGWVAAGHFRDGILLAPATARVMAQMMAGEPTDVDVSAFSPFRFVQTSDNRFAAAL